MTACSLLFASTFIAFVLSTLSAEALPIIIPLPTVQITSLGHRYTSDLITGNKAISDGVDFACGSGEGSCSSSGFSAAIANGDEIVIRYEAPSGQRFHVFHDSALSLEGFDVFAEWVASSDRVSVLTHAAVNFENLTGTAPTETYNEFGVSDAGVGVFSEWEGNVTGDFTFTALTFTFPVNNSPPGATAFFGPVQGLASPSFGAGGTGTPTTPDQIVMRLEPNGPDTDGDGIADNFDNCPYTPNGPFLGTCLGDFPQGQATCHANSDCTSGQCSLNQEDTGGVGVGSAPDGIGDACQCGDVNNDGIVTTSDNTILARSLVGLSPYFSVGAMPGAAKCDLNGDGLCSTADKTILARGLVGLSPGIKQVCPAAIPH